MKNNLFKSVMLAVALVAGVSSAQAATFTMIGGTNIDFFYDTAFWSGSTASVANNVLTFTQLDGFSASVAGATRTAYADAKDSDPFGVVAVAQIGYKVANDVVLGASGGYTLAKTKGAAEITSSADVYSGKFYRNTFSSAHLEASELATAKRTSTGTAASGSFSATSANQHILSSSRVLGLDVFLQAAAGQLAGSSRSLASSSTLSTASYGFTAIKNPVMPVPEPETYAMMLAGLGLLGVVARRKNQA